MPCRASPAAARAIGRSTAGCRPSASGVSSPNCTQAASCPASSPEARANCSPVRLPVSVSSSGGGAAGGVLPGSGSPRSSASRCSLMTRSGRYWSRWAASTYRSRATSAEENFRYPDGVRWGWTRSSDSRYRILLIVTSGKSSRSTVSTSPIVRRGASRSCPVVLCTCVTSRARSRAGGLARARTGQVHEAELADLHLVAPGQRRDVDRLAVDVGAVEAADVVHREAAALAVELHVPAADGDVVEEDVAVGVPAGGGDVLVEQEAAAGVWGPPYDQQGRAPG